jgi:hypothetical protein
MYENQRMESARRHGTVFSGTIFIYAFREKNGEHTTPFLVHIFYAGMSENTLKLRIVW